MRDERGLEISHVSELDAAERQYHERFMAQLVERARQTRDPPFRAILLDRATSTVVAEGINAVGQSPLLHGETAAIDACARQHRGIRWQGLTLYTTAEPCAMCAAAIAWTRIGEVVFATDLKTLASFGINLIQLPCADVLRAAPFYRGRLVGGVLSDQTDPLYSDWAAGLAHRNR